MNGKMNGARGMFIFSIVLNLVILPLSFYIGNFETNPPTNTASAFILRFFLIQGLPLMWLLISIYAYFKTKKQTILM
jgi:hypothetical protein